MTGKLTKEQRTILTLIKSAPTWVHESKASVRLVFDMLVAQIAVTNTGMHKLAITEAGRQALKQGD